MSTSFITTLHREGSDWVIKRNICRFSARLTKYTDTVHYRNFSDINICKRWQLHICLMFICFRSFWSVDNNTLCIFCVCTDSIVDTLYSVGRFHQVFVPECDYTCPDSGQWPVSSDLIGAVSGDEPQQLVIRWETLELRLYPGGPLNCIIVW